MRTECDRIVYNQILPLYFVEKVLHTLVRSVCRSHGLRSSWVRSVCKNGILLGRLSTSTWLHFLTMLTFQKEGLVEVTSWTRSRWLLSQSDFRTKQMKPSPAPAHEQ